MKTILFFGDSITDCKRDRNDITSAGTGYPLLIKSHLGFEYPDKFDFINTGISGNRIVDVYAAIKSRFINHAPDYASILIGVNDVWHEISRCDGVSAPKFEKIYSMMIEEIKEALPDIKIILMAPFVLEGPATAPDEACPNKFEIFKSEVALRAEAVKRIAEKYDLELIELQPVFDKACESASPTYWLRDGVHPTPAGHEIIKREWLKAFDRIK